MENKEKLGNVYARLSKARKIVLEDEVRKSATNGFAKFNYMTLEDIVPVTEKACHESGIITMTTFDKEEVQTIVMNIDNADDYVMFTCPIDFTLATGQIKGVQAYGALHTYFRRYMLMLVFEIIEHDGIDAQDPNAKPIEQTKKPKQQPKQPKSQGMKEVQEEIKQIATQIANIKSTSVSQVFREYQITATETQARLGEIKELMLNELLDLEANNAN